MNDEKFNMPSTYVLGKCLKDRSYYKPASKFWFSVTNHELIQIAKDLNRNNKKRGNKSLKSNLTRFTITTKPGQSFADAFDELFIPPNSRNNKPISCNPLANLNAYKTNYGFKELSISQKYISVVNTPDNNGISLKLEDTFKEDIEWLNSNYSPYIGYMHQAIVINDNQKKDVVDLITKTLLQLKFVNEHSHNESRIYFSNKNLEINLNSEKVIHLNNKTRLMISIRYPVKLSSSSLSRKDNNNLNELNNRLEILKNTINRALDLTETKSINKTRKKSKKPELTYDHIKLYLYTIQMLRDLVITNYLKKVRLSTKNKELLLVIPKDGSYLDTSNKHKILLHELAKKDNDLNKKLRRIATKKLLPLINLLKESQDSISIKSVTGFSTTVREMIKFIIIINPLWKPYTKLLASKF